MIWTARQRAASAAVLAILLVALAVRLWMNPAHIADPQPEQGILAARLADRIDPNTADEAVLAALPAVGPALAERIVAARNAFARENPGRLPFTRPADLRRVKGIGQATTRALEPYLLFPVNTEDKP